MQRLMSSKMWCLDWLNKIVGRLHRDALNLHSTDIPSSLQWKIDLAIFGLDSVVVVIVHDLGAEGHLMVFAACSRYSTKVLVIHFVSMGDRLLYLVMVTLDLNRCPNHDRVFGHWTMNLAAHFHWSPHSHLHSSRIRNFVRPLGLVASPKPKRKQRNQWEKCTRKKKLKIDFLLG